MAIATTPRINMKMVRTPEGLNFIAKLSDGQRYWKGFTPESDPKKARRLSFLSFRGLEGELQEIRKSSPLAPPQSRGVGLPDPQAIGPTDFIN